MLKSQEPKADAAPKTPSVARSARRADQDRRQPARIRRHPANLPHRRLARLRAPRGRCGDGGRRDAGSRPHRLRRPRRVSPCRLCAPAQARRHESEGEHHGGRALARDRADRRRPRHGPCGDDRCRQSRRRACARVAASAGSARAAPITPAPARSTRPSRSRTAWSGSTARRRASTTWRRGAAPSPCSAPTRSRWRSRPATRRRSSSTSPRRSPRTAPSGPTSWKAGRCRRAGCRTARTARRSPIRPRSTDGTYLPMGGYKGSGLSIIIGLLAGPLNGAAFGRDIRDFAAPPGGELNVGQFVVALDVARFVPPDLFKAEVDRHIRDLASSRRLPGVDEIRVPGQGRVARRIEREKNGVPLTADGRGAGRRGRQVARHHAAQRAGMSAADAPSAQGSPFWRFSLRFYRQPEGCRCLHRAAGGGGRRRQSAAVSALAGDAQARIRGCRGRGARAPHRRLA